MRNRAIGFLVILLSLSSGEALLAVTEGDSLFTLRVKPLLTEKCAACHGGQPDKIKGGLDLTTRDRFLQGGDEYSDTLVPGVPGESMLLKAVRWEDPDLEMPPKENDRLTDRQIEWLERWVELGAPWPSEETQVAIQQSERERVRTDDGVLVKTSGGTAGEWTYRRYQDEDIWAFQPVEEVRPPAIQSNSPNPIDAFVRAR